MLSQEYKHTPVLLNETISHLQLKQNGVYLDATFGNGGYSKKILETVDCKLYAIDQDPIAAEVAKEQFPQITFMLDNFRNLNQAIEPDIIFDGIVFDIGVSSMQIDTAERGFSFNHNGPLDMRMSPNLQPASELLKSVSEEELAGIIYNYGDEKQARKIARAIIKYREEGNSLTTTSQLANIVRDIVKYAGKIDPATRTFQAIRIWVNDELANLRIGLRQAFRKLKIGGRLVVVTFHSGEDSIVKSYFKNICGMHSQSSRYHPAMNNVVAYAKLIKNKAIMPTKEEISKNPRARSAKLRVIEKVKNYDK